MVVFGGDADALRATAERFVASSAALRRHGSELSAVFRSAAWSGPDAELSRAGWQTVSVPALARASSFMETLGRSLHAHADAQERASAGEAVVGFAGRRADGVRDVVGDLVGGDAIDDVVDGVIDDVDAIFGRLFGARSEGDLASDVAPIVGLRPSSFADPGDGRANLVAAMEGFADESRIGRDEIEIRALDNGRYVVVLPGVTDLSRGLDEFTRQVREDGVLGIPGGSRDAYRTWTDNDEPTVRKMRYAYEAALRDDRTVNEYSIVVAEAMRSAGVPEGAEVMIVGHSFGAYTAIDLAAEPTFNSAAGAAEGYHVDITHVVAAGAETDWRFDEIPAATDTLVLNNRWDAVYQAENLLHVDASPSEPGHVEAEFWGGGRGYGHDEHNYIDWVRHTDDRDVERWLEHVGRHYSSNGTRVSVRVPDPNLE